MEKLLTNREPLMTTAAVAKWLGVSTRTLCLWAECKEIPAIKIGRQMGISRKRACTMAAQPGSAQSKRLRLRRGLP